MAPSVSTAYLDELRALLASRVRFVVVGSFGLELFLGDAFAHEVKDCDIVVERTRENLERVVSVLSARAWELGLGEGTTPLPRRDNGIDLDALTGKGFFRATRGIPNASAPDGGRLQLDVVYEPQALGWARLTYAVADLCGVPVAAIESILAMQTRSSREVERAMAARVEALLAKRP